MTISKRIGLALAFFHFLLWGHVVYLILLGSLLFFFKLPSQLSFLPRNVSKVVFTNEAFGLMQFS